MEPRTSFSEPVVVPPLTVSAPSGHRVTVAVDPAAGVATLGDLADAFGLARRSTVLVDGQAVDRRLPLGRSGLVEGSRVTSFDATRAIGRAAARGCLTRSGGGGGEPASATGGLVVSVEAGPDAGRRVALGPGRHVVGRASTAAIGLDDSSVELHHAVVDVATDGRASLTQLAGRVPCRWLGDSEAGTDRHVDRQPDHQPDLHGAGSLGPDSVVFVGSSRLRFSPQRPAVERAAVLTVQANDPWRRSIHRAPRSLPTWAPTAVLAPAPSRSSSAGAGGLLAALLSVVGGVAIAVVMRNPMFLLFSVVGLFVSIGTRLSGRLTRRKEDRQRRLTSRQDRDRFVAAVAAQRSARAAYHRAVSPLLHEAVAIALQSLGSLWERRAEHDDVFGVTLGWGAVSWEPAIDGAVESPDIAAIVDAASRFGDARVRTELGPGASVAVVGDHADAIARAVLVQLAVFTGPADWRLVVVSDRPDRWRWAAWLPHAVGEVVDPIDVFAVDATLGRLDDGDGRHVVVVTDRADLLANRTGALRRFLGTASSVAVLAVVRDDASVPSMCRSVLEVGSLCHARWCPDTSVATSTSALHAAGVTLTDADDVARSLACIHDPEDPAEASGALPPAIGIGALMQRVDGVAIDDPIALAAAWRPGNEASGRAGAAAGHPTAVIGVTPDGVVEIDLVRDGPHALIAGTTGSGKSELLRTLVASLAARSSPEDLTFVLIDYKGGSTFDACADLPHTVGLVTDLDEHLAARALSSLEAEIRRRERLLRDAAAEDLDAYRVAVKERPVGPAIPRLVVVIDEFAALKTELPGFLTALVGVAQRGRSLGIHLVLATQRPAGVVSDDIRANTNLRIALRLNDRADAVDIVGDAAPAGFARGTPGRAMMRLGPSETLVFQTATSLAPHRVTSGAPVTIVGAATTLGAPPDAIATIAPSASERPAPSELTVLTRTIRQAASLCEIAPPFRPWLEALPESIAATDIDTLLGHRAEEADSAVCAVVGVIDDPASQRRLPLRWEPRNGNLALIGSFGSGTTTALRTVLAAGPPGQHVYVLDARGDGRLDELANMPGCGGVVGRYDSERRARVLRLVGGEVARRQSSPRPAGSPADPPIVLAIDGLTGLLDAVSAPGDAEEHATLVRIVNDGVAVGVSCVATLERGAGVSMSVLAAFGQRWLFHLDDPGDGAMMGLRPMHVPPAIPGRIVLTSSKLEAQLAMLPVPTGPAATGATESSDALAAAHAGPPTISTLPDDVATRGLPPSRVEAGGATSLTAGLEFATMRPTAVEVPDGEHVLVVGPARSGRSTALVTLAAAWRDAHPDGSVVVHAPRPTSPVAAWARAVGDVDVVDAVGLAARARAARGDDRTLFVVDDAERVEDLDQAMLSLVGARHPLVLVLGAARPDALRTMYGHWTSVVRRSRTGMAMASGADTDAELFGESVPRRLPIPARRGLAWVFDGAGRRLVQIARHQAAGPASPSVPLAT